MRRPAQRQSGRHPGRGLAENQGVTNRIQALLGVEYPVVQAPMTYIARAELAAAVSEGGGLGMIETLTPEGRADLRRVRELTDRPVAANLMIQGWKRDPSIVDELVGRRGSPRIHLRRRPSPVHGAAARRRHDRHPRHRIAEGRDEGR